MAPSLWRRGASLRGLRVAAAPQNLRTFKSLSMVVERTAAGTVRSGGSSTRFNEVLKLLRQLLDAAQAPTLPLVATPRSDRVGAKLERHSIGTNASRHDAASVHGSRRRARCAAVDSACSVRRPSGGADRALYLKQRATTIASDRNLTRPRKTRRLRATSSLDGQARPTPLARIGPGLLAKSGPPTNRPRSA